MFFKKKKKNPYGESVKILASEGYTDKYIEALKSDIEKADPKDKPEGNAHLACTKLFRGELTEAKQIFSELDFMKLPDYLVQTMLANYILCLFLLNNFRELRETYVEYNRALLSEPTLLMRRSLGIYEFTSGNYDAATTIFLKLEKDNADDSRGTMMADVCLARTFMKLEMYEQAMKYSRNFGRYEDKDELGKQVKKLSKQIFEKLTPEQKVEMVKTKVKNS